MTAQDTDYASGLLGYCGANGAVLADVYAEAGLTAEDQPGPGDDQAAAGRVIGLIAALDPDAPDAGAVAAARAAYNALTDAQKALVTNYQALLDAEAALAAPSDLPGDLNHDGDRTVADVVLLRRAILASEGTDEHPMADMNEDGSLTVADVVLLRRAVLGQTS